MTEPSPAAHPASPTGRRTRLIVISLILVFALLCTGAVFAGIAVGSSRTPKALPAPHPSATARAVPSARISAVGIPTCSISGPAGATALQQLYASVVNVTTGKTLYSKDADTGQAPAGVEKVVTAAAAISALGPDYRITTSVLDSPESGAIVLQGQGDATLSRADAGKGVYPGAPTLASLASQASAAYQTAHPGVPITKIILDSSYWDPSDNWLPSWPRSAQTGGLLSEATALQVDGDRADPTAQTSPRSTDPVTAAGSAFIAALGLDPSQVTLTTGTAENGAPVLGTVQSQPVKTLVSQMLLSDDNTLAEMLARIVSVKEGLGGSSGSLQGALTQAIDKFGVSTANVTILDGSGQSPNDALPAAFTASFLAAVSGKANGMQYVAAGIPVAGKSGSLAGRFRGANASAAGKISAASGHLDSSSTLSGYVTADDGTPLAFSFSAIGDGIGASANGALDTLATATFHCGGNLASF